MDLGSISLVVILRHEGAPDNLSDLIVKVSAGSFADIENLMKNFIMQYNQRQERLGNPTLFDWYVADFEDLVAEHVQIHDQRLISSMEDDEDE